MSARPRAAEELVGAALALRHAVEAGLHLQRFARGEEDVGGDLLGHHADGGAGVARALVDVAAPDGHRPGGLAGQAREDVDEGRLAGAVGAQQAEDRAARDRQVDALQRPHGRRAARGRIGLDEAAGLDGVVGKVHWGPGRLLGGRRLD